MVNLQLDWERVSCFCADNENCHFGSKHSYHFSHVLKALSFYFLGRPTDCFRQLYKHLSIDDDSTEIPQIIEINLMFTQHVMALFK